VTAKLVDVIVVDVIITSTTVVYCRFSFVCHLCFCQIISSASECEKVALQVITASHHTIKYTHLSDPCTLHGHATLYLLLLPRVVILLS
jgi:hypothetical protein